MTLTELARVLGISRTSCYEYARRKELPVPVVRIGRRLLVSRVQVIRFLEGRDQHDG
ncbi:MAG: helix-turn-helix domain-containing protein [Chloroflexi bacterium]|nr:helix-turn-helix domain-containing protein [Chloroflexota bacterium]